jgi:protein-S-isoprenylcysteine O-methyltransferase Ste14
MLLLRSLFFAIVVPGTVAGVIPYLIVSRGRGSPLDHWGPAQFGALLPIALGASILLRCIWEFAHVGRGTLAPIDPPKELVVSGLYRYVRNPMYVGVFILLLGEALLFESVRVLEYMAGWSVIVQLFVALYEEPALRRRFGESYERYCRSVRRWLPGRPFAGTA